MESDFAEDFTEQLAMDDDGDDALAAYDDEEDTEQWVERIIELNRVTTVGGGRDWPLLLVAFPIHVGECYLLP